MNIMLKVLLNQLVENSFNQFQNMSNKCDVLSMKGFNRNPPDESSFWRQEKSPKTCLSVQPLTIMYRTGVSKRLFRMKRLS